MESSQTNPVPDILRGIAFTQEPKKGQETPPEDDDITEEEMGLVAAETYSTLMEAKWESNRTKSNILLAALDIPQTSEESVNTMHPFWTTKEYTQLKTHYLTFLLSL